jgi:hypothetical protein
VNVFVFDAQDMLSTSTFKKRFDDFAPAPGSYRLSRAAAEDFCLHFNVPLPATSGPGNTDYTFAELITGLIPRADHPLRTIVTNEFKVAFDEHFESGAKDPEAMSIGAAEALARYLMTPSNQMPRPKEGEDIFFFHDLVIHFAALPAAVLVSWICSNRCNVIISFHFSLLFFFIFFIFFFMSVLIV